MAISSTTINDLIVGTSTLTITSGSTIENVVYTNSTKSFLFSSQLAFTFSPSDFIQFIAVLDAYNVNIQAIFNPALTGIFAPTFNIRTASNIDDGINTVTFVFQKGSTKLYDKTAIYPSGQITCAARANPVTLTFEEWTAYHDFSRHFESQIHHLYHL